MSNAGKHGNRNERGIFKGGLVTLKDYVWSLVEDIFVEKLWGQMAILRAANAFGLNLEDASPFSGWLQA
jgi:hypothetical protein